MTKEHFSKVLKTTAYLLSGGFIIWWFFSPLKEQPGLSSAGAICSRIIKILGLIVVGWLWYFNQGWKWKKLQRYFIEKPDLVGTWMGFIVSSYKMMPADGGTIATGVGEPIMIVFSIHQDFFSVKIDSYTETFRGISTGEVIFYDPANRLVKILYQFAQQASLPGMVDSRKGAAELYLYKDYLAGYYWTLSPTIGFIRVSKVSDEKSGSFEEAIEKYKDHLSVKDCFEKISKKSLDYSL